MVRLKKTIILIGILLVFLIVPFKQQFLHLAHTISHVINLDNPLHSHTHDGSGLHTHHHSYIAQLEHAMSDQENSDPIPINLLNFHFQLPFPSLAFTLEKLYFTPNDDLYLKLFIPVMAGVLIDVPTPPP